MQNLDLAAAVAATVARRDPHRLSEAVTETVRLRALLPAGPVEAHGRADVAARFHAWFADFDTVEVLDSAGEAVADRVLIHYRLGLSQAERRWVCTQTAVCKVVDGRLAVIDLLCSGLREVSDDVPTPPAGSPSCPSSSDRSRPMPPDGGLRLRQDEPHAAA